MSFEPPEEFNIADYYLGDRLREGRGERTALRTDEGTLSYADVDRLANRFGNALSAFGVRQEQRVLVALPDGPAFAAALFGTLRIGAVVVMVNAGLPAEHLAAVVAASRAAVAVVAGDGVATFRAAATGAGRDLALLVGEGAGADGAPTVDDLDPPDTLAPVRTHRHDPAIWLFSGGTTGRPKLVVQTHQSFANTTECYAKQALAYTEDDITISVPKLYFGYATGSNLFFPFAVGGSAVLFREPPTADALFARIRANRPTILVNVPKLIAEMVDHPDAGAQDLSSLRFATSAGEALPPALHERWTRTFGVELLDGLGTAEMWHVFVSNTPGHVRPGSLGRPVPGFDVRVRDAEGGDLPAGEVGRLWVRGRSRAIWYWQDLDQSAEAFRGEWFAAGDLIRRDDDGYVYYEGRADDAMKVGGKWLLPAELESCLAAHADVRECVVVGVPDPAGLTKPVAFVVPARQDTADLPETLRRHALDHLEAYKHPRRVVLVESLPRTHLGKVDRGALKRRATAAMLDESQAPARRPRTP